MAFTEPTFAEAKTALASRLNDPNKVHWVDEELGLYITEALRTYNAWTAHWRDRDSFTTVQNEPFYDLPTEIPTLREQTVTNWDVIRSIQYKLIEGPTPSAWSGTDQFTLEQIINAVQRRRDQFLQETGAVLTRTQPTYTPPASGRIDLDESVLTVRRAAWRPTATQVLRPLIRTDEWAASHYTPAWTRATGQPPGSYSVSVTPPLVMQLIPAGGGRAGTLDLLSVSKGADMQTPTTEVSLGVPNDWAWVVEYGALADLLQGDGLALDPQRAAYCQSRWDQGIAMAKKAPVVLNAGIQN